MNAERFLAYYEQVADAPDAVARLRTFVLDLAVRGKLVPQDATDEPASELLKRIAAEKTRLGRKERNKRELKSLNGNLGPTHTPKGWILAPLADLVAVLNGRAYKQSELLSAGTPVLRVGNLFTSNRWYYSNLQLEEDKYCENGDLIFAWSASFGPFIWTGKRVIYHYHIWKLLPHSLSNFDKHYLYNFLLHKTREIKAAGHGISMIHMTKEKMEKLIVPLPPLAEQHRIVAKVNELMGLCDRLEAARADRETVRDLLTAASLARLNAPETSVPAAAASPASETSHAFADHARFVLDALPAHTVRPDQIRGLRHTILNLAVRGKLVPQNAKDEPASKLLDRIAKDKAARAVSARDRRATKIKPLLDIEAPFPLPENWLWASFGDITISRDSERIPVSREERAQKSKIYDYYGASGIIDKIDGYLFDKPLLLIGEDGANLLNRSTPIAFIARGKYWVNNHAHVLDGLSESFLQYLDLFINATDLKPYVTGTAQPKMNQAKMNNIPVALPPLAEQTRIVAKVNALMALCDRLEASLTAAADTRRRLLDALLAEALAPKEDRLLEAAE